jgi:hypothetical protein
MHTDYKDIIDRITEPPTWYDENGVPRYGEFTPDNCPNIYSSRVGLFKIACQHCGKTFCVEMHANMVIDSFRRNNPPSMWHYGDPPFHGCVGDSMNCIDVAVVQFWEWTAGSFDWIRAEQYEGEID